MRWDTAGMAGFTPARRAFRHDVTAFPQLEVMELAVADVQPVQRQLSHGVFNDSVVEGTARERVVRILEGFRKNAPIPPVEVVSLSEGPYAYRLYHGAHRFCCAVAAGFVAVPAVDVTHRPPEDSDFDEWMRGRTPGCT